MQIFNNILSNAIKFTPDHGIIKIVAKVNGAYVDFKFIDGGVGISEEQKKEIFEIRKRGSTDGTRGEKGTGFGIPLLNHFVKQYQGQLKINSPAQLAENTDPSLPGTEFHLRIPLGN